MSIFDIIDDVLGKGKEIVKRGAAIQAEKNRLDSVKTAFMVGDPNFQTKSEIEEMERDMRRQSRLESARKSEKGMVGLLKGAGEFVGQFTGEDQYRQTGTQGALQMISDSLADAAAYHEKDPFERTKTYVPVLNAPHEMEFAFEGIPEEEEAEIGYFQVEKRIFGLVERMAKQSVAGESFDSPKDKDIAERLVTSNMLRNLYAEYNVESFENTALGQIKKGAGEEFVGNLLIGGQGEDEFLLEQKEQIGAQQAVLGTEYPDPLHPVVGLGAHALSFAENIPRSVISVGYAVADYSQELDKRFLAMEHPEWNDEEIDQYVIDLEKREGKDWETNTMDLMKEWNSFFQENQEWLGRASRQVGDEWYVPLINDYIYPAMDAMSSMAPALVITYITKNPKIGAAMLSIVESSPDYIDCRKEASASECRFSTGMKIFGTYKLELIGIENFFNTSALGKSLARKITKIGLVEGATEVGQEVWQNIMTKVTYNESQDIFEGAREAFIGAMIAGGAGAMIFSGSGMQVPPELITVRQDYMAEMRKAGLTEQEAIELMRADEEVVFNMKDEFRNTFEDEGGRKMFLKEPGTERMREGIEIPAEPPVVDEFAEDFDITAKEAKTTKTLEKTNKFLEAQGIMEKIILKEEHISDLYEEYDVFSDRETIDALKEDILEGGHMKPLVIDGDKTVLNGNHRLIALQELGVNQVPTYQWVSGNILTDQQSDYILEQLDLIYEETQDFVPVEVPKAQSLTTIAKQYDSVDAFVEDVQTTLEEGEAAGENLQPLLEALKTMTEQDMTNLVNNPRGFYESMQKGIDMPVKFLQEPGKFAGLKDAEGLEASKEVKVLPKDVSLSDEAKLVGAKRIAPDRTIHQQLTSEASIDKLMKYEKELFNDGIELVKKYPHGIKAGPAVLKQFESVKQKVVEETATDRETYWYNKVKEKIKPAIVFGEISKIMGNKSFFQMAGAESKMQEHIDDMTTENIKKRYMELVKKDISKGYRFPEDVLAFDRSLTVAVTSRARYEKGLRTSFSSDDTRIVFENVDEIGAGMKRQDGKIITREQMDEIKDGVIDFSTALALDMKKLAADQRWVYVHLNGKNPFLKKDLSGMYRKTKDNISISVGGVESFWQVVEGKRSKVKVNTTVAHELSHVIDYMVDNKLFDIDFIRGRMQDFNLTEDYGRRKYYRKPTEVVARMIEQYVAVQKGSDAHYDRQGYWSKEIFETEIKPAVEVAIQTKFADYAKTKEQTKELQPLAEEAKKYKTAEEFVKAITYYHGSNRQNIETFNEENLSGGIGKNFTQEKSWADKFGSKTYEIYLDDAKIGDTLYKSERAIPSEKTLKKQGIDAVKYMDGSHEALKVISLDKVKITSEGQLTDIWNEANKKIAKPITPTESDIPGEFVGLRDWQKQRPKYKGGALIELQRMEDAVDAAMREKNRKKEKMKLKLKSELIDRFAVVEDLVKKLRKQGHQINIDEDPYIAMRMYAGISGIEYADLTSFQNMLKDVNKHHLESYLKLERLKERAERGFDNPRNFDVKKADQGLSELKDHLGNKEYAAIEEGAQKYYKYMDGWLKALVLEGFISDASYKAIKAKNLHYAPFQVVKYLTGMEKLTSGSKSFSVGSQDIVKSLKGTQEDIVNVLPTSIRKVFKTRELIEKNRVMRKLLNLKGTESILKRIKNGETYDKGLYDTLSYFEKGQKQTYLVPKELADAVKGMNAYQADVITGLVRLFNKPFKAGATALNVAFSLPNMARDIQNAILFARHGIGIKSWLKGAKSAALHEIFGHINTLYDKWLRSGASFSGLQRQIQDPRVFLEEKTKELTGKSILLKVGHAANPFVWFEKFNAIIEEATRLGVYDRALKGKKPLISEGVRKVLRYKDAYAKYGIETKEQKEMFAAFESRRATLDFSRMGKTMNTLNVWWPFLNARVQGLANTVRVAKEHPAQFWVRIVPTIILPTLMLYGWNHRDEETERLYNMIPQWERDLYFIIMIGGYTNERGEEAPFYAKIPKGDIGQIMGSTTEAFLEYITQNGNRDVIELLKNSYENLSPWGDTPIQSLNPLFRVPVEWEADYNFFMDREIVGEYGMKNLAPEDQYNYDTSQTAKAISSVLSRIPGAENVPILKHLLSPAKLEHGLYGFTAGLGKQGLYLLDTLYGENEDKYFLPQTEISRNPIAGRFFGSSNWARTPIERSVEIVTTEAAFEAAREDKMIRERAYDLYYQVRKLESQGLMKEANELKGEASNEIIKEFNKIDERGSTDRFVSWIRTKPTEVRGVAFQEWISLLEVEGGRQDEIDSILSQMSDAEYKFYKYGTDKIIFNNNLDGRLEEDGFVVAMPGNSINAVKPTRDEYDIFKNYYTIVLKERLGNMYMNPDYKKMTPVEKAKEFASAKSKARKTAADYTWEIMLDRKVEPAFRKSKAPTKEDYLENRDIVGLAGDYYKAFQIDPENAFRSFFTKEKLGIVEGNLVEMQRDYGLYWTDVGGSLDHKRGMMKDAGIPLSEEKDWKREHIVPVSAGGDNSEGNLYLATTEMHDFYTPIDIAVGKAVKAGRITRKKAEELMRALKVDRTIGADDVISQL